MENRISKKLKNCKMEKDRSSSIVGFALAGLAVGAAAWYLFGTKEGRDNFDRAVDGISEVSHKLKKKAKENMDKGMEYASEKVKEGKKYASEVADNVKDKFEDATEEARDKGREMASDAKELANKAKNSAEDLIDEAKSKSNKYNS